MKGMSEKATLSMMMKCVCSYSALDGRVEKLFGSIHALISPDDRVGRRREFEIEIYVFGELKCQRQKEFTSAAHRRGDLKTLFICREEKSALSTNKIYIFLFLGLIGVEAGASANKNENDRP